MPIAFPPTPTDGEVFNENGQYWQWSSLTGAWRVYIPQADDPIPNAISGWRVGYGGLVTQWGLVLGENAWVTVTFPIPYIRAPLIQITSTGTNRRHAVMRNETLVSFQTRSEDIVDDSATAANVLWQAMGQAT